MSKKTTSQIDLIIQTLKNFPKGALIEEIQAHSGISVDRRTLQRRLKQLQNENLIKVTGLSRATRYHFIEGEKPPLESSKSLSQVDLLPLTQEAKKIRNLVTQPLQHRSLVSYNRGFLDAYKPNITTYLTMSEIERLSKLGKTAIPEQPAGTFAKAILSRLLIDLSWNSSRLEGNTYSLLDTQRLISYGEVADDKSAVDAQMILNHKDAIEFLVQSAEYIGFNRYTILNLHALLSNNLLPDPTASGRLRRFSVGIHQSVYQPLEMPQLIEEVFTQILDTAEQIKNPFEQAFFVMVHLPYLQPFDDVNKRVSRLAANIPFARHNFCPLSFIDVPNDIYIHGLIGVYELNRIELLKEVFLWAYERSAARYSVIRQSLGEPDRFRMKYREIIGVLISTIVSQSLTPKAASAQIRENAKKLTQEDQDKFVESVDSELLSLHEGNIARYKIRPSEFKRWKEMWSQDHNIT